MAWYITMKVQMIKNEVLVYMSMRKQPVISTEKILMVVVQWLSMRLGVAKNADTP